jgi:2'-hydroxyisoflavone reductase
MPATPLEVTAADVLAWDCECGQPPLRQGFSPEEERAALLHHDNGTFTR